MAYQVGGRIEPADFNDFKTTINQILGPGTGTIGYGQTIDSTTVSVGDTVTAASEWTRLLNDLNILRRHQTGNSVVSIPSAGDQIQFLPELESEISSALSQSFLVGPGQSAIESDKLTNERTTVWEGTIIHGFHVNFGVTNENQLRYFFNSGGQVRVFPDYNPVTGTPDVPGTIDNEWKKIIQGVGDIVFDYDRTTPTGSQDQAGVGSEIGYYDLTTTFQRLFTKSGGGTYAGGYGAATLELWGRKINVSGVPTVHLELRFNSVETGLDFVTLNVSSNVGQRRAIDPDGELIIATPLYQTVTDLSKNFDANLVAVVMPDSGVSATFSGGSMSISADGPVINTSSVGVLTDGYIAHTSANDIIRQIWNTTPDDINAKEYEVRASEPSNTPSNIVGVFDTWTPIALNQIWSIANETSPSESMVLEIRKIEDTTDYDRMNVTFNENIVGVSSSTTKTKRKTPRKRF